MPYRPIQRQQKKPPRWHTCPGCGTAVWLRSKGELRDIGRGFPAPYHSCHEHPRTDMTTGEIDAFLGATDVPRDRWGRPMILTPDGKRKAYTRCTTYVGCLEDTYNLTKWQMRMVATGLSMREDLALSVAAHLDDKSELDKICEAAKEAAASSSSATKGTALHKLCERLDRGEDVQIPTVAKKDIAAYKAATAGIRWSHIERITVHDELQVAGTPDRGGAGLVWDIKTGDITWGIGKIAMQMALYAHSLVYDPNTGERTPFDVSLDRAVIIHLPAGEGRCELVEVDIAAGWEAVQLATQVRAWRARKGLSKPYTDVTIFDAVPEQPAPPVSTTHLARLILEAPDELALRRLWAENRDAWTPDLTKRAAARKAEIAAAS